MLALMAAPAAAAPDDEAAARAVLAAYFTAHNRHALDEVMALYSDAAGFTLSMGRGTVTGRPAIRRLELFDAMAGSDLHPVGVTLARRDGDWHVDMAGVLESSAIFRAMGLAIVRTLPIRSTMVIRAGQIIAVVQPELPAGCTRNMATGLAALATWLRTSRHPLADLLLVDDRVQLREANITELIIAINAWRAETHWQPDPADVARCAGADF